MTWYVTMLAALERTAVFDDVAREVFARIADEYRALM